eukprot:842088-Prymnesium_polylepis.1
MPLTLSAASLCERAAAYEETLLIDVRSARVGVARTQLLHVALTVQASTSFAVWGAVVAGSRCNPSYMHMVGLNGTTTAWEVRRVAFTACDSELIPVDHQLPSQSDERRFSAILDAVGSDHQGRSGEPVSIEYGGAGTYILPLILPAHGGFRVTLQLGELIAATLNATATCSVERVPLDDGRCGCRAGSFQLSEVQPCKSCSPESISSPDGAIGSCDICSVGYFRPRADSSATECSSCAATRGFSCGSNTTTETLNVSFGYWRPSTMTTTTYRCKESGAWSPCRGGVEADRGGWDGD